jgi:hypothetical protein
MENSLLQYLSFSVDKNTGLRLLRAAFIGFNLKKKHPVKNWKESD